MNQYVGITNLYVAGMAEVLGMSHEQVQEKCSIRELLLYVGTLERAPSPTVPATAPKDEDAEVKAFEAEVLNGN